MSMLADSQKLLAGSDNILRGRPNEKCVHELFEAQVGRSPDAVAAVFEKQHITYQELNRRSNRSLPPRRTAWD